MSFFCRYKVLNALLAMEGRPRVEHPLSSYIEVDKDAKTGAVKSVLKIPYYARQQSQPPVDDSVYSPAPSIGHAHYAPITPHSASPVPGSVVEIIPPEDDRGTADGGFTDLTYSAGTADVYARPHRGNHHSHAHQRGVGDGAPPTEKVGQPHDEDSDFDDFSDGDEHVNIIEVVNGPAPSSYTPTPAVATSNPPPPDSCQDKDVSEIYMDGHTREAPQSSTQLGPSLGRCSAIYDYTANLDDELSIRVGDVISVHDKQADGWWLGALEGRVGIFPATYVEELPELPPVTGDDSDSGHPEEEGSTSGKSF